MGHAPRPLLNSNKIGIVLFPNANADALEKGKLCKYLASEKTDEPDEMGISRERNNDR